MSNANHKQNRADEQENEISLVVGSLFNYSPAEDRESYEEEREWVQQLQDSLRQEGVIIDFLLDAWKDQFAMNVQNCARRPRYLCIEKGIEKGLVESWAFERVH